MQVISHLSLHLSLSPTKSAFIASYIYPWREVQLRTHSDIQAHTYTPTQRIEVYCPQKWKFAFGLTRMIKCTQQCNNTTHTKKTQLRASSTRTITHALWILGKSFGEKITSTPSPCPYSIKAGICQICTFSCILQHINNKCPFSITTSKCCAKLGWGIGESEVLLCLESG